VIRMWRLGRHLGTATSALVDGQLAPKEAEQAWEHVLHCPQCRRLVEREGWVKRQLNEIACKPAATDALPERLLGSLYDLGPSGPASPPSLHALDAWAAVDELEARGRTRRRVGIALVGAGSVSAAVLGFSTLSGASLGIGGTPAGTPATSLSRGAANAAPTRTVVAPRATVHGRLPGWKVRRGDDGLAHAVPVESRR
jgi:hypothetical protein